MLEKDNYLNEELINESIYIEQIQQIYNQIPITIIGPVLGAFITAAILQNYVSSDMLSVWLLLVSFSYGLFIIPWYSTRKNGITASNVNISAKQYTWIGWFAALSWGSISLFLFVSDSFNAQIFLAMSVMVGISAIMSSTIIYRPVFYTILAMSIPMVVRFIYEGSNVHYFLALGCAGYTVMLFFLHASMNKSMVQSLKLQFINEQLAVELNIQKESADKANLDKSKFLAAISHDLRQPLHAHSLFFGELQSRLEGQCDHHDLIMKLETSLESIGELFNTLLDLSKLEAGVIKPDIQSFYLQELMTQIEQEYKVKSEKSGLKFRVVRSNCVIRSDKVLLGRIIRNLLENALKHNRKGKILFGCRRKGKKLFIQILDNGLGIKENEQKYIFDEYYQIGKDKQNKNVGVGLGLSVVKEQCKLLGHDITLSSVIDKGSVFTIEVPVSSSKNVIVEKTTIAELGKNDLQGLNIMVIDDEISIQEAMAGILSSWGSHVIVGATADEILDKLKNNQIPDIILSDYNLKDGGTGIEAIEQLRNVFGKEISAAIITGDVTSINQETLKNKKYPLLLKPVNLAKLRTLLRFLQH